jgi:hypothetical protein
MKRLAPIPALFAVTNVLAHPGHGGPDLHFHVEWLLVVAAVGLLWWVWKR